MGLLNLLLEIFDLILNVLAIAKTYRDVALDLHGQLLAL